MHKLSENYKVISLIHSQTATSTVTGTGVDLGPAYEDDALAILDLGAASDTDATLAVVIQGSDAVGGTYATLLTFTTLTASSDNKIAAGGFSTAGSANRFIRAVGTIAGTGSPSFSFSVSLLIRATLGSSTLNSVTAA